MALNAACVFEVRTGGADTNGGGFKTGAAGTDWTLQNAAQYSVTDGVTDGTTTITSATANFGTDVVGNVIYVQGGTGSVTAGWYEITARTNSTTITVDRSTGLTAGTGVTLKIGGALASLAVAASIATVAGHTVFQKSGTYSITSATINITGGCPSATSNTLYVGYDTTRTTANTDATRPLNQFGAVSTVSFWSASTRYYVKNIDVDGTSQTTSKGVTAGTGVFANCKFSNFTGSAVGGGYSGYLIGCSFTGCSSAAACAGGNPIGCESYSNTISGFSLSAAATNCLSYNNSGASSDGYQGAGFFVNCIAYNNGRTGFFLQNGNTKALINCISESNAVHGYNLANATSNLLNCAASSNGTARITGLGSFDTDFGVQTYTGSAFTNAASNNFSLNTTAGAGAALRATGFPGVFPRGTTTGYLDIGAAQHQDPATTGVIGVIGS